MSELDVLGRSSAYFKQITSYLLVRVSHLDLEATTMARTGISSLPRLD